LNSEGEESFNYNDFSPSTFLNSLFLVRYSIVSFHFQEKLVDSSAYRCSEYHQKTTGKHDLKKEKDFFSPPHREIKGENTYNNIKEKTNDHRRIKRLHPDPVALLF
jgi:hypothetical protein